MIQKSLLSKMPRAFIILAILDYKSVSQDFFLYIIQINEKCK